MSLNISRMQGRHCNLNTLSRPDGSALYSQGKTAIVAGVYGPTECKNTKILIDKAHIEMHYRPKSGLPTVGDRLHEAILKNICETSLLSVLYPRTSIVIVVQEMQSGGELIASAVNACCLALLDSGIDMKFLVAGISCCMDKDGNLYVDPTTTQMSKAAASFIFVFDSFEGSIVASHTTGIFTIANYTEALKLCKESSASVFDYYRQIMKKKLAVYK